MSSHSVSAPLPEAATSVGLGYGIAIAVGILVLVSTIMLASYVCVRVKGSHPVDPARPAVSASSGPESPAVVVTGLDGPTIDSYPKFTYDAMPRPADDTACPICLSDYRQSETLRLMPECQHCFHAACVDEWLRMSSTCPLCRNSPAPTPLATPLSELVPLAAHARSTPAVCGGERFISLRSWTECERPALRWKLYLPDGGPHLRGTMNDNSRMMVFSPVKRLACPGELI